MPVLIDHIFVLTNFQSLANEDQTIADARQDTLSQAGTGCCRFSKLVVHLCPAALEQPEEIQPPTNSY